MKNYLSGKDYTVGLETVVQVAFGELVVSLSVFVLVSHLVLALLPTLLVTLCPCPSDAPPSIRPCAWALTDTPRPGRHPDPRHHRCRAPALTGRSVRVNWRLRRRGFVEEHTFQVGAVVEEGVGGSVENRGSGVEDGG